MKLTSSEPHYPFITDGCSGGLSWAWRKLKGEAPPWEGVCIEHDKAYWIGGTKQRRADVDGWFFYRIADRASMKWAYLMWIAVRIGGHPLLPFPWRWGYGWRYGRGYDRC